MANDLTCFLFLPQEIHTNPKHTFLTEIYNWENWTSFIDLKFIRNFSKRLAHFLNINNSVYFIAIAMQNLHKKLF